MYCLNLDSKKRFVSPERCSSASPMTKTTCAPVADVARARVKAQLLQSLSFVLEIFFLSFFLSKIAKAILDVIVQLYFSVNSFLYILGLVEQ